MPAVATVTQPAVTVTATSTSSASSTLTAGDVAGIIIGTLLGCVLLAVLVFYLHRRYGRHKFTRVPNHTHDSVSSSRGAPDFSSIGSPRAIRSTRHSQKPSVTSEPLIAPLSWPPIPLTSRVHSPSTPPRTDSVSPGVRESQVSIGEVNQVSYPTAPNIPPARIPEQTSSSPKPPQQPLFVHRMLQSRARASDFVALAHQPSLDSMPSPSATVDSATIHADIEQLLADAERAALRDAEVAQKEEDDWDQISTSDSVYSQLSAPHDQSLLSSPISRQNSVSVVRRKSSRRRPPATAELSPVTEVPDTPRGRSDTLSIGPNSSLDAQVSHGTVSRPISLMLDESAAFPLLTSVNFGKDSAASGATLGSITSTAGWGSNSSGRASRYPSLAPSSIGLSSHSGLRSDDDTDWRHLPPGLSGLKTLQIGPLRNPHSPVEERAEPGDASFRPGPADKRAHLRQGTASSVPEVEHRAVMGGGIARIDVAL